uniref:Switching B cell complex subunit SWAP70a n=1 Tax=Callorhinchus milii TaxID=7868 RepID=A0A4W3JBS4_CALMI
MGLREELLKAIWHAFSALDVDKCGKVSKSQLKVLSHSLCTVLQVPHNPVALENHFKDDDEGPVSNQGYMPYLNKFILDKVQPNTFSKCEFNRMCWTLCAKKNLNLNNLLISDGDAFKVWCIFNFLSEDLYPLVIVPEEIEYFLQKLTEAMGVNWQQEQFEEYKEQLGAKQYGLSVWGFIELVGSGLFSKGMNRQTLSMAIDEVYHELILDVMKQVRKDFVLILKVTDLRSMTKPHSSVSGSVDTDQSLIRGLCLENACSLPDKDGKKCLLLVKCSDKSFEISAPDKKKKQEWIQGIQTAINLVRDSRLPPHKEGQLKRRGQRQRLQAEQEEIERRMKELQMANEDKQVELEKMRMELEFSASKAAQEEKRRLQSQMQLQDRFRQELEKEKMVREQMEKQVAQKSTELEQHLQRVRELEEMYKKLEEALEDERQARQDEEMIRKLQARLLEEECAKRADLERLHLQQQQAIQMTEAEKQELEKQRAKKDLELKIAMEQLEQLALERVQVLEQYDEISKKLELAANKAKNWKDKVAQHEGLLRLIQPGSKNRQLITNWGPAAFTDAELTLREKNWQQQKNAATQ